MNVKGGGSVFDTAAFWGGERVRSSPPNVKKKIRIHFVVHVSTIFISFLLK